MLKPINELYTKYKAPRMGGSRTREDVLIQQSEAYPKPVRKGLLFHLPFTLLVPPGFEVIESEDPTQIRIKTSPHPNNVFDVRVSSSEYSKKTVDESIIIPLRFLQVNHAKTSGWDVSGIVQFNGDRLGKLTHTSVYVEFPIEKVSNEFKWDNGLYCDLSIDAVNRFVEHYKVVMNMPIPVLAHIPAITSAMVMNFKIFTGIEGNEYYVEDYADVNGMVMYYMPEEIAIKIKGILLTDEEPDLITTYHFQINNNIGLKDWRSVAIDSAVLFERWMTLELKKFYKSKGLNSRQIKDKFSIGEEHRPMAITDIVTLLIPDSLGISFKNTDQCKALLTHVFTLRNHVVHGRRFRVSRHEATLSYKSVEEAIKYLKPHLSAF
jgi:hypothetical protein